MISNNKGVNPVSELDSDVNEDRNREQQLDQSFEEWYAQMENQIHQQEGITRVPNENVFEAAEDMDAGSL
jgi:hypothetical protein